MDGLISICRSGLLPRLAAVVAAAAMIPGCSIKEDRSACPCSFILDFSDVEPALVERSAVFVSSDEGLVFRDMEIAPDMSVDESGRWIYTASVPRTGVRLGVVSGDNSLYLPGQGLLIPLGSDCPPVFIHYSEADASADEREQHVMLHKDFCEITVNMESPQGSSPFRLVVRGNVCGLTEDRQPVTGDFSYGMSLDADGCGTVRVSRQTDSSLLLQIWDGDLVLREFALGEYIVESGYDWSKEDLEDVDVEIDYASSSITVDVADWSGSFGFEVVI